MKESSKHELIAVANTLLNLAGTSNNPDKMRSLSDRIWAVLGKESSNVDSNQYKSTNAQFD